MLHFFQNLSSFEIDFLKSWYMDSEGRETKVHTKKMYLYLVTVKKFDCIGHPLKTHVTRVQISNKIMNMLCPSERVFYT